MMTHDEIIAVVKAHKEGKPIQCSMCGGSVWTDCGPMGPYWNFDKFNYRVKHEPRTWRVWVSNDTGKIVENSILPISEYPDGKQSKTSRGWNTLVTVKEEIKSS